MPADLTPEELERIESLVASAWAFARREAWMAARAACSDYALAAFRHRGDPVLLLLSDELKEIECPHLPGPDHERDLALLAQVRNHDRFEGVCDMVEHASQLSGAWGEVNALLLRLLRGG